MANGGYIPGERILNGDGMYSCERIADGRKGAEITVRLGGNVIRVEKVAREHRGKVHGKFDLNNYIDPKYTDVKVVIKIVEGNTEHRHRGGRDKHHSDKDGTNETKKVDIAMVKSLGNLKLF